METELLLKKKLQAVKAIDKANKLNKEVYENCHHPSGYLEAKEHYYEGGYDHTAITEYWDECTICCRRFNKQTKNHGWYG